MPNTVKDQVREKLIECYLESNDKCLNTKCRYCDYFTELENPKRRCHAAMVADNLIANGATIPEWISVEDRLPSDRGDVLVCAWWNEKWQTKIGWYNDLAETFHILTTEEGDLPWEHVTHWMPLPMPPKEEK